uniref:DNA replication complex GINS protein SLD5 n=1 Tax=Alexandrium catenella TaxID=2925 RepID=A0A7S1PN95_ALECA|mmetsp:Transcript_105259/g.280243  ORF Transcript_105259/g.280243 Transcript_105259/m.280243 type:complete len:235 (+) Transcript_105259:71-775(+)
MDSAPDSSHVEGTAEGEDEVFHNKDVEKLFLRWQNEKFAPEVLPFDRDVAENISEMVEYVGEGLEEERGEGDGQDPNDPDYCLRCVDLERIKYLLRDYLRIRLWKLSQWPQHYLEPANIQYLSDAERQFLREFWNLKKGFFESRLLGGLPTAKQGLDDKMDLLDMVRRPALDKHVYARLSESIGPIEVPPTSTQDTGSSPEPLTLQAGNTYLLRWPIVRNFFLNPELEGKVQLV